MVRLWVLVGAFVCAAVLSCSDDDSGSSAPGGSAGSGGSGGGSGGTGGVGSAAGSGGSAGSSGGAAGSGGGTAGAGGSSGSTGGSAGSGGGPACNATTHACIPDAPLNWTGPVALAVGSTEPPACPGTFPTAGQELFGALNEGTATCSCTCDAATGMSCSGNAQLWAVANPAGCEIVPTVPPTATLMPGGACAPLVDGWYHVVMPAPTGGMCASQASHTLATPAWGEQALACSGVAAVPASDCGSGTACMPTPPSPFKLCVFAPGDEECPTTFYSQKFSLYSGFSDSRACSACSCGSPTGSCGRVRVWQDQCNGTPHTNSTSSCLNVAVPGGGGDVGYQQIPQATCTKGGGELSGSVTTQGQVTYCCAP